MFTCTNYFNECAPIFGDRWTLLIVGNLAEGEKRFGQLQREIKGVSPVTLSSRLKKLEAGGIITRSTETIDKLSVTYCLTQKGHDMLPVLQAITDYARKHSSEIECA